LERGVRTKVAVELLKRQATTVATLEPLKLLGLEATAMAAVTTQARTAVGID
jgi:hypothetical protein